MRGSTLGLATVALALLTIPANAASGDVTFEGGAATCVNTPHATRATGTAEGDQSAVVAADSGTVTIHVVGSRVGIKDDGACTFDVAITGGEPVGLAATSPRAAVTGASSAPCVAGSHVSCVTTATASWSLSHLNTRASLGVNVEPAIPWDVDVEADLTSMPSPSNPPSGALGVDVFYEIGVTAEDGVRHVVATGSVRIWDVPAAVTVQGQSIP